MSATTVLMRHVPPGGRRTRLYSYGLNSYGLYSHGLCSYGLNSYGLYSHGLCSYGLNSYGLYSYGLCSHVEGLVMCHTLAGFDGLELGMTRRAARDWTVTKKKE